MTAPPPTLDQLAQRKDGATAWACGIVTMRQQPETATGVVFVTLEDETGRINIIGRLDAGLSV